MRRTVLCLAAGALAVLFLLEARQTEPTPPARTQAEPAPVTVAEATPSKGIPGDPTRPEPASPVLETESPKEAPRPSLPGSLPASLRGTEVDGELVTDGGGRLVVTRDTRAFFDYFLAASGEESPDMLRTHIVEAIETRLPAGAASEAVTLLDRYLLYRERAHAVDGSDPEVRLRHLRDLRREVFGTAVAEALFGDEERQDAFALEARRIQEETDGERRRRLLKDLERDLPRDARRARAEATAPLRLLESERALAKDAAGSEERRREREARWGEAVADRLETLETARAEWNRRLQAFREARSALLGDEALNAEQRSSAIAEILSRDFTPEERLRVVALDRIGGDGTR